MIKYFALHSSLSSNDFALNKLKKYNLYSEEINIINDNQQLDFANENISYSVVFILTGGTESLAQSIIDNSSMKSLIVAFDNENSLPASIELRTYYKDNPKVEMFHFRYDNLDQCRENYNSIIEVYKKAQQITKMNFGLIGGISDWLIGPKRCNFPPTFNINLINIELKEVLDIYHQSSIDDINSTLDKWSNTFNTSNIDKLELEKSAKLYYALYIITKKYKLSALTIKCFDLLKHKVTACLALAELNRNGLIAGCEGDTQALYTLVLAKAITNQIGWMANVSDIDEEENLLTLAHCTVPIDFLSYQKRISLDTHMESNLNLAINGHLNNENVTILRIGENHQTYSIMEASVIDSSMDNKDICRTQAIMKINEDDSWVDNLIGNHQIVLKGLHKDKITAFLNRFSH